MSLLIQINSADQITPFLPRCPSTGQLKEQTSQTNNWTYDIFLLIRRVLSHYDLFHSALMLQQLSIFLCMFHLSVLGPLAGCLVKPKATSGETRPSVAVISGDHQ